MRKAIAGFGDAGDINRLILLITDGDDHDSFPLEMAEEAREKGIRVVCIGFGDEMGSKIEVTNPRTRTRGFIKDREGNDVISRLNGEMLREIALKTEGAYVPAGTGALDLDSIYQAHIETLLVGVRSDEERIVRNEIFQWPLLAAILVLLVAWLTSMPWRLREKAARAAGRWATGTNGITVLGLAMVWALAGPAIASAGTVVMIGNLVDDGARLEGSGVAATNGVDFEDEDEDDDDDDDDDEEKDIPLVAKESAESAAEDDPIPEQIEPREAYNRALPFVQSDPDSAEKWLNRARRDAGGDGEIRYRSLYNLGWVSVSRADRQLEAEPKQALVHLEQAANRFRESIRVRPESQQARHNLELISRRILELTDALNKTDPKKLDARLDELIGKIRDHQTEIQTCAQTAGELDQGVPEEARRPYRQLGVTQRQIISDMQRFAHDARQQVDSIQAKSDDEVTDAERLQTVQLTNMLGYIDEGLQRMKRARSLTRRLQAPRAFLRWAAALSDAKRARDQLRNPGELLGVLLSDASDVLRQSGAYHQAAGDAPNGLTPVRPVWLTSEYLAESQRAIHARTGELVDVFNQVVAAQAQQDEASSSAQATQDPQAAAAQRLVANMRETLPVVDAAVAYFELAASSMEHENVLASLELQMNGIDQLAQAAELFFDIRRLIEAIYRDERLIQEMIRAAEPDDRQAVPAATTSQPFQEKNLVRCPRLQALIDQELSQLGEPNQSPTPPAQDDTSSEPSPEDLQRERLQLATHLLEQVKISMEKIDQQIKGVAQGGAVVDASTQTAEEALGSSEDSREDAPPIDALPKDDSVPTELVRAEQEEQPTRLTPISLELNQAVDQIEELRRLFFSVVEHLRDTARRQADLYDETALQQKATPEQLPDEMGPLTDKQEQLGVLANEIAKALVEQGQQAAAQPPAGSEAATGQPQQNAEEAIKDAEKFAKAAALVEQAGQAMAVAQGKMSELVDTPADPKPETSEESKDVQSPLPAVLDEQSDALEKLLEALKLLDENQDQDQNDENQQQQDQQDEQQNQDQQEEQQRQQQEMSAQQLLQLVRDREAKRRKDKQKRGVGVGNVEKDW